MTRRPVESFDLRAAVLESEEVNRWFCRSCDAPIDPDCAEYPNYCWPCGSYWEDVATGLWEDPIPEFIEDQAL